MYRIIYLIFEELYEIAETLLSYIPGRIGVLIRRVFYKIYLGKSGKKFASQIRCRIHSPGNVFFGDNSGINVGTIIAANKDPLGKISFGSNVLIGHGCFFHSGNHIFSDLEKPIKEQGYKFSPIIIEDNVWIGAKSIILSGVVIEKGSIVAAGSVVTKSVPQNVIVGGNPAKVIRVR